MDRWLARRTRVFGFALAGLASLAGVSYAAAPAAGADGDLASSAATAAAPTWATLYRRYMAKDTVGDCASCHEQAATAEQTYAWLAQQQYMAGDPMYLVDRRTSCFSWLGGDMPPDGPSSYARAQRDFAAWAAANTPIASGDGP